MAVASEVRVRLLKHASKAGQAADRGHSRGTRIRQLRVSQGVSFFGQRFMEKYRLEKYSDRDEPVAFYGMYERSDYLAALRHRGHLTILWRGSDTRQIPAYAKVFPRILRARHLANPEFTSASLWKSGIPNTILPITPTIPVKNPQPRGDAIYFYTSMLSNHTYGDGWVEALQTRVPHEIITAHYRSYGRDELEEIYRSCFIGLRLTRHDGLPNTVCELGLMGRRCLYNGKLPNAIPYDSLDDIVRAVHVEYENRCEDNSGIADAMHDFLEIGDSWLQV